jgi:hypothetical protein
MLHALTPAADLDVSVRARRLACVLDPALLLATPHALLLVQQLARGVDLWVCPAFWRLLDASEFFGRRPARLRSWLGLASDHPAECIGAAIACWSRWRGSRDLAAMGLYWVGGHQTESFLPEQGPRDLPARFEALVAAWMGAAECELRATSAVDVLHMRDAEAGTAAIVRRLHGAGAELLEPASAELGELATDDDGAAAPAHRNEAVLEAAALAVALQVPVLTLAAAGDDAPALVRRWAEGGLAATAWTSLHPASASAERERWWSAILASGAGAVLAAASANGVRPAIAHVVAPSGQFLQGADCFWADELAAGESWGDEDIVPPALTAGVAAPPWWRDAQALWLPL